MKPGAARTAPCALLLALGGCAYPHLFTTQPDVTFQLHDPTGAPLPGARVVLSAIAYPPPAHLYSHNEARTDATGQARFISASAFEWGVLAMHGSTAMVWSWCADAPGHAAQIGALPTRDAPASVAVTLAAAREPADCMALLDE
jgi:hypothetical protein